jgi:hypothetical protein
MDRKASVPEKATVQAEAAPALEMRPGNHGGSIVARGRWKPGQSGNPSGKPKGEPTLTPRLRRQLNEICPTDKLKRPWVEVLPEQLMTHAMNGNASAIRELWERIDGKVQTNVEVGVDLSRIRVMTDDELEAIVKNAGLLLDGNDDGK